MSSSVRRFAPFLAIAALQLAYMTFVAPRSETTLVSGAGPVAGQGVAGVGGTGTGSGSTFGGGTSSGGPGSAAAGGGQGAGGASTVAGTSASGQPVDQLGRPLEGDRSKCAPDGLLQQNVTSYSIPCIPALEGSNGGATHQGVTEDEIVIVQYQFKADEAVNAALATQGLAASHEKYYEVLKIFEQWFNKHYEFYGRKVRYEQFIGNCEATDFACYRADAKALVKKYHPFAVERFQGPWQFADELARQGVVVMGSSWGLPRRFFNERRPYVWDIFADGESVADTMADYWCKKLANKPAEYAGDPALTIQPRRLGIVSTQDEYALETAGRLVTQLDGGMCDGGEKPVIYTISDDANKAQEELPPVIARMKEDGITTVTNLQCTFAWNLLVMPVFDNQQYFPEHFMSGTGACDHDLVGRFASPTQRSSFFGLGWQPKPTNIEAQDDYKAVKEIDPGYNYDSYVLLATFIFNHNLMFLLQSAGPNLTPETLEAGAFSMPQLGGWENAQPWPGWKCCDPLVTMHKYVPGEYAAHRDTRNLYWDERAVSPIDGKPGSYVCLEDCRRWSAGTHNTDPPK